MNDEKVEISEAPKTEAQNITPDDKEGATRMLKKEDLGPIMVFWSKSANRKRLQDLRAKFKKALKGKWNGILLHLLPGETIGSMKLPQVQALYEAMMRMFDPDLYEIRMTRKAAAEEEAKRKTAEEHELTANQIADRLASIQKQNEVEAVNRVQEASARIALAASQKTG